jgi:hypothetical protein
MGRHHETALIVEFRGPCIVENRKERDEQAMMELIPMVVLVAIFCLGMLVKARGL